MGPLNVQSSEAFHDRYKILEKIGEGSYSDVLKCKKRESGVLFACKRLKHSYRGLNEVNEIAEIKFLRKLSYHPNILLMSEVHFDPSAGRVCLVFEIMDKNLYELIKDRKRLLADGRVRVMMFQLMRALRHLHKHGIFHRDVKPENILLKGENDVLKLGDFGSVRSLSSKSPYTEYISTRWYRAPECLLTAGHYSFKMDIWAVGCVFYEIITLRPLFPGSSELDQINRIHSVLGAPPPKILQKFCSYMEVETGFTKSSTKRRRHESIKQILNGVNDSKSRNFDWYFPTTQDPNGVERLLPAHVRSDARDLLRILLCYDPDHRPSSHRALQQPYFDELRHKAREVETEAHLMIQNQKPILTIVGDQKSSPRRLAAEASDKKEFTPSKSQTRTRTEKLEIPLSYDEGSRARRKARLSVHESPVMLETQKPIPTMVGDHKASPRRIAAAFSRKEFTPSKSQTLTRTETIEFPRALEELKRKARLHAHRAPLTIEHQKPILTTVGDHKASPRRVGAYDKKEYKSLIPQALARKEKRKATLFVSETPSTYENQKPILTTVGDHNHKPSPYRIAPVDKTKFTPIISQTLTRTETIEFPRMFHELRRKARLLVQEAETPMMTESQKPILTTLEDPKSSPRRVGGVHIDRKKFPPSISQTLTRTETLEFPRAFIDKNRMSSAKLRRINENRAMVQLEPIGGTDIKRSILASDIPQNTYYTRSVAKATKQKIHLSPFVSKRLR